MRPSHQSLMRALVPLILLSASLSTLAHPTEQISAHQYDERDLKDVLSGAANALGTISQGVTTILATAQSLLATFISVVQALEDATNENDLVNLLGVSLSSADANDNTAVTNATIRAMGGNNTVTCPGLAVLYARGTAEPGNVGLLTGPSFFAAIRNYVNGSTSVAVQGIPYPATVVGFADGGSAFGSSLMALMVKRTAAACPDTKLVLAGYSQGAQVVHNAMVLINRDNNASATAATPPAASARKPTKRSVLDALAGLFQTRTFATGSGGSALVNQRVLGAVLFGDPRNGTAVAGLDDARVLRLCNAQDAICARGAAIITLDHLTYSQDAPAAAMFVMQKSRLGLASADAVGDGMGNVPVVGSDSSRMNGGMQIGNSGVAIPGLSFLQGLR